MKVNRFTPNSDIFKNLNENKKDKVNELNFSELIKEKLDNVNEKQLNAEETTKDYINGNEKDVHNVMIATAEAKLSLDMAIEVRNKIVEAYQEINRMQI